MADDNIIDFQATKDRRVLGEIDDDTQWDVVRDQLHSVMRWSELHDLQLTSATLNALLHTLQAGSTPENPDGMSQEAAKAFVAASLKMFGCFKSRA